MDLDIIIINARHFTSKKNNKVYNTLDYILVGKDNFFDSDKFKGYTVVTSFVSENCLKNINILETYKAHFDNEIKGIKSTLKIVSLVGKDGKVINLS